MGGDQNGNGKKNGSCGGQRVEQGGGQGRGDKTGHTKKVLDETAELIIIALLLADELVFDSIEIDREGSVFITLLGKIKKNNEDHVRKVTSFLEENEEMSLRDAIEGLRRHLNRR